MTTYWKAYCRYVAIMLRAPLRRQLPVVGGEILIILAAAGLVTLLVGLVGGAGWQLSTFGKAGIMLVLFDVTMMLAAYASYRSSHQAS